MLKSRRVGGNAKKYEKMPKSGKSRKVGGSGHPECYCTGWAIKIDRFMYLLIRQKIFQCKVEFFSRIFKIFDSERVRGLRNRNRICVTFHLGTIQRTHH